MPDERAKVKHTHTHTDTHTHTNTHTHRDTCTHTHKHTQTHTNTDKHTHTHPHTHTRVLFHKQHLRGLEKNGRARERERERERAKEDKHNSGSWLGSIYTRAANVVLIVLAVDILGLRRTWLPIKILDADNITVIVCSIHCLGTLTALSLCFWFRVFAPYMGA